MVQVYCSRFPFTTMFSTNANELQSVAGLPFRSHNSGVYSQKSASLLYPLHCWCPRQEHDLSAVITSVLSTNVERDCTCFPWLCFVPQLYLFFCTFVLCLSVIAGQSCPAMSSVQRQSHICFCLRFWSFMGSSPKSSSFEPVYYPDVYIACSEQLPCYCLHLLCLLRLWRFSRVCLSLKLILSIMVVLQ